MNGIVARWIGSWEHKLANRDTNRVVRPFEWGHDWLNGTPAGDSDSFFSYRPPDTFHQENGTLRFSSAVQSPYPVTTRFWPTGFRPRVL